MGFHRIHLYPQVKGLSEMDLMSGKNGVISSISAVDSDCMVESSCPSDDADTSFHSTSSPTEQRCKAKLQIKL